MADIRISKTGKAWEDVEDTSEYEWFTNEAIEINGYLDGCHRILNRPNFKYKEKEYVTAKVVINLIKKMITAHAAYLVGNSVSISGDRSLVKDINAIYKKGNYSKVDFAIATQLYSHGNAFEWPYIGKDGVIRSHLISNEDANIIYGDDFDYRKFIEEWYDSRTGKSHTTVYYPDRPIEKYVDDVLQIADNSAPMKGRVNLVGLPIHYRSFSNAYYSHYGKGIVKDLIPLMDEIEELISHWDDTVTTLILNPIGVLSGSQSRRVEGQMPKEIVGGTITVDEGDFKFASPELDSAVLKELHEGYIKYLYCTSGLPSIFMGQTDIANLSEDSLQTLFMQTDNIAREMALCMREGMMRRFEYFRKLLTLQGKKYSDKAFDSLDINFNYNRPVNSKGVMEEMQIQYKMGALSRQTIIDKSPFTTDTAEEIKRIEKEQSAKPADHQDEVLAETTNEGEDTK